MASTRNRNTPGNYNLEQREYKQFEKNICDIMISFTFL